MKTQMGAAQIPTSAGALAEVATRERYLSPDEAAEYLNVSVGFIRRMASERRVRHYRLGRFIRFDPADLDAFAEVKEPLTGSDPALATQVWRRSRRASRRVFRFDPQARVRALADPVPDARRRSGGLAGDLHPPI